MILVIVMKHLLNFNASQMYMVSTYNYKKNIQVLNVVPNMLLICYMEAIALFVELQ